MLERALSDLRAALKALFADQPLRVQLSWPLGGRAVSEIGGRLIEDFVAARIDISLRNLERHSYEAATVALPSTGRALEDFSVNWVADGATLVLLVDVKGHNELRRGSRPNLASIRKCIELYSDPARRDHEPVIFFCRYRPSIAPNGRGDDLSYDVLPESFGPTGLFPLRCLSAANLDPANIGSGGQLLLARENRIVLEERSREDFVALLRQLGDRARARVPLKVSRLDATES